MAQFGMRDLQGQIPGLLEMRDTIGDIAGRWGDVARAAFDAIQPAERYASLSEKFGIDPHAFDVDVFGRMKEALGEIDVEADVAEKAMLAYELATGMATGSSVLFDERLRVLAGQLGEGTLTADDFARAVMDLGAMDFSWIDGITQGFADTGGIDAAMAYLERVAEWGRIGTGTQFTAEEADKWLEGVGLAGGAGAAGPASPLTPMLNDMQAITDRFATAETDWGTPVMGFVNLATGEFSEMETAAGTNIDGIGRKLDALSGKEVSVTVDVEVRGWPPIPYDFSPNTVVGSDIPVGGRDDGTFALGGWTGSGPAGHIAGLVHNQEYVVPRRGALVLREGGGGGAIVIQTLNVNGVEDPKRLFDLIRQEARRQNAGMGV